MAVSSEHRPRLIRSVYKAAWITAHAGVACLLLTIALGKFAEDASRAKTYVFSDLTAVMTLIRVPLHPLIALAVLFTALAASLYVVSLLWDRLLQALDADDLDRMTGDGLAWALKQQFQPVWLVVPLMLTGSMLLAAALSQGYAAGIVLLSCIYLLPLFVLRPRWLGSARTDPSWFPSGVALAVYALLPISLYAVAALFVALGIDMPGLTIVFLALQAWGAWLAASALISVRNHRELLPHLGMRLQRRFAYLMAVAIVKPLQLFVTWFLPSLALFIVYAIFVAPTVQEVSAYLPPVAVALHKLVSTLGNTVSDYWYVLLIPTLVTTCWLYVGRCIVLFDE
jgi:hypothetical protein